jgi:beta-phosphoglucomutase
MPNGVIFDMDGVLVNSGEPHKASWQAVARQHGIDLTDEVFERTFGMSSREIVRKIWGPQISDDEVRRIDEEKERIYRRLISGNVPLSPGAHEAVERLAAAGYVLAVGTSGPRENLELVLNETGLGRYFAAAVNGLEVPHGKPAPDIFLKAAERAGLRPADCVVIEDAPVGIQAALTAGMKAIGYVGTHPAERLQEAGAARVVERLTQITPELIAEVLG